jgi:hypothetical protein
MKRLLAYLFIVLGLGLTFGVNAAGNLQDFLNAIKNSKESGVTIDLDSTAKEYDYKNFKSFVKDYKKEYELPDLTENEVREFLLEIDRKAIIIESQENLDILHNLIVNNKYFKKRTSYFKKKYKDKLKLLIVYINYEKEMSKITINPNLKKIGRFDFRFQYGGTISGMTPYAFENCEKSRKKYKLSGGDCIIVESRIGDNFTNLLKQRL